MSTASTLSAPAAPLAAPFAGPVAAPVRVGLDGLVVAETVLSEVDGERGHLILSGYDVESLSGRIPFAAACHLLATGHLPDESETRALDTRLGLARVRAGARLPDCAAALRLADPMDALRAALAGLVAALPAGTPAGAPGAVSDEAVEIIGAVPVYAAAWARVRQGAEPVLPDAALPHAADFLRMITGTAPDAARAAALDAYLVTVCEHGMNASTFTARVVASTGSDLVSAVVAALGALKGPLHGGAPGPVLDMLDAIGEPQHAVAWLEGEIAARRRIMGMGHRVYRVRDPRAAVLEQATLRLETAGHQTPHLRMARAVERAAEDVLSRRYPDRPLRANVEFYTAVLLDAVGLPRALFTPAFAVGRVAGWCAHVTEQRLSGRLIRPDSRYVGPRPASAG